MFKIITPHSLVFFIVTFLLIGCEGNSNRWYTASNKMPITYSAPVVQILSLTSSTVLNLITSKEVTISGTCSENDRPVLLSGVIAKETPCQNGSFSTVEDLSLLLEGENTITAQQTNAVGSKSAVSSVTFLKDTVAPLVKITSPLSTVYINDQNQTSFIVSGTCETGVDVSFGSAATGTTECLNGLFTTQLNLYSSADGPVVVTVSQTDSAGNTSTPNPKSFTKLSTLPTVTFNTPGSNLISLQNYQNYSVGGSCSVSGQNVVISGDANAVAVCQGSNTWSATLNFLTVNEGNVSLFAKTTDLALNTSLQAQLNLVLDKTIPVVTLSSLSSFVTFSNQSSYVFSGTCSENGQKVFLTIGFTLIGQTVCAGNAFNLSTNLSSFAEGGLIAHADHSDAAGNPAIQASLNVTKDSIIPTVSISSPSAGTFASAVNAANFVVSGSCSENGKVVLLRTGSLSVSPLCTNNLFSGTLNVTSLTDGAFTVTADHSDTAGNSAVQATRAFTKDTGVATVAIATPLAASAVNSALASNLTVSGSCSENGNPVVLNAGSVSMSPQCTNNSFSAVLNLSSLSDGTILLTANHSDSAGNTATQSTVTLSKDTTIPTVAITGPAANSYANATNASNFVVSGTCSESGRAVQVQLGQLLATPTCSGNTFSTSLNASSLSNGAFTVKADHTDAAGNSAIQSSRSFFKDSGVPTPGAFTASTLVTAWSFKLNWTAASDAQTLFATNLEYFVCTGSSLAPLLTVNGCLASTVAMAWTPNILSLNQSGTSGTTYYFNVLVRDQAGNMAAYNGISQATLSAFISDWKTDNLEAVGSNQITLPLEATGTYNFTVDWGDNSSDTITVWNSPAATHTYASSGIHTVTISGTITGFRFNNAGDKLKILSIKNWGPLKLGNSNGYFYGAQNLTIVATDILDLTGTTNLADAFANCSSLTTVPHMNDWDVSQVTYMRELFSNASLFNENISNWNVSKVTDMSRMFQGANAFNQPIGNWNVSKVTNMAEMFVKAYAFNQDIGSWDVSNVTSMSTMFADCPAFNQPIGNWNVSKVTDMHYMFSMYYFNGPNMGPSTFNQPLGNWNVSNVVNMNAMFAGAVAFNQPIGNWNVSKVTAMGSLFASAQAFNQDISNWNVSKVTDMGNMFIGATAFNQPIGNWDVSSVTSTMGMFYFAQSFNQPLGNWNVSSVTNMYHMFNSAYVFNQDISNWDVSKVTNMSELFAGAYAFNQNIGNWNVSSVTTMQDMFLYARSFNQNIGNWNVSKVTDMSNMFNNALAFNQNLGNWDVSKVTDMYGMFSASSLSQANYDALLIGWSALPLQSGLYFHTSASTKYSTGAATLARSSIITNFGWHIFDGGQN